MKSCLKALEAGYRHIDTAQYYENEAEVGQACRKINVPRSELYLTTKILSPAEDVESTYQKIADSVEKLDGPDGYVDLFLIHSPNAGQGPRKIMWQALELAKEHNKVRDIGVSNYGIQHIEEIKSIGKTWPPAVNQIEVGTVSIPPHNPQGSMYILNIQAAPLVPTARRSSLLPKAQHRN